MDPDETLKSARAAAERVHASSDDAAIELAEAFEALDGWLSKGGFLPADWKRSGGTNG